MKMLATSAVVRCDAESRTVTFTLPPSTPAGRKVQIRNIGTTANFECIIEASGNELIGEVE